MKPYKINLTPTRKAYKQIIEAFVNSVTDGTFKYGMRINNESELLKSTNVSRPTLREALRILEFLGLIKVAPRVGIHVRNPESINTYPSLVYSMLFDKTTDYELFEFRSALIIASTLDAAKFRTGDDLKALSDNLKEMNDNIDADIEKFVEIDINFHNIITACAKNRVFVKMLNTIIILERSILINSYHYINKEKRINILKEHTKIFEHIRNKDEAGVREIISEHLIIGSQYVRNNPIECYLSSKETSDDDISFL
jgi:DNA-binding FadR family transcriptional regulator